MMHGDCALSMVWKAKVGTALVSPYKRSIACAGKDACPLVVEGRIASKFFVLRGALRLSF
eukprot:3692721-Amphidinium_carterae.2